MEGECSNTARACRIQFQPVRRPFGAAQPNWRAFSHPREHFCPVNKLPILALIPLLACPVASCLETAVTLPELSPAASVSQVVGVTEVKVTYHRPSVLKREVWGKLVPYGFNDLGFGTSKAAPWRAGANETTLVSFQHDVVV